MQLKTALKITRWSSANKYLALRLQKRTVTIQQLKVEKQGRERLIILGSGWAGYTVAHGLDSRKYQVIVVSPRSYFVFTPLLASTSVGTLEFRTTLEPVRSLKPLYQFFQGWADAVDFNRKALIVEQAVDDPTQSQALTSNRHEHDTSSKGSINDKSSSKREALFELEWDKLVIAVGCYAQTFGTTGVKENAYFLKDVGDARKIRNRLLSCFESAALPNTPEEMKKILLNFAVVGGGPTGIEWAAEAYDIINEDMKKHYPDLIKYAHITIYDVAPKILSMFDEKLSKYAMDQFKREGISVKTDHHIQELRRRNHISADGENRTSYYVLKLQEEGDVDIGMCVWSTGLMMNPFVKDALAGKVKRDLKNGGILTNDRLQVLDENNNIVQNTFALGDCAVIEGTAYPATAQVASQKATWLMKRLNKGDIEQQRFNYKNLGVMAYIGKWNAIADTSAGDISGRAAWLMWRSAYLAKSISWRNKVLVPIYW